jgi:hypothetical protein
MYYITITYGPFPGEGQAREFIQRMENLDETGLMLSAHVVNQYGSPAQVPPISEDDD